MHTCKTSMLMHGAGNHDCYIYRIKLFLYASMYAHTNILHRESVLYSRCFNCKERLVSALADAAADAAERLLCGRCIVAPALHPHVTARGVFVVSWLLLLRYHYYQYYLSFVAIAVVGVVVDLLLCRSSSCLLDSPLRCYKYSVLLTRYCSQQIGRLGARRLALHKRQLMEHSNNTMKVVAVLAHNILAHIYSFIILLST